VLGLYRTVTVAGGGGGGGSLATCTIPNGIMQCTDRDGVRRHRRGATQQRNRDTACVYNSQNGKISPFFRGQSFFSTTSVLTNCSSSSSSEIAQGHQPSGLRIAAREARARAAALLLQPATQARPASHNRKAFEISDPLPRSGPSGSAAISG
jgi:hypothetical protein